MWLTKKRIGVSCGLWCHRTGSIDLLLQVPTFRHVIVVLLLLLLESPSSQVCLLILVTGKVLDLLLLTGLQVGVAHEVEVHIEVPVVDVSRRLRMVVTKARRLVVLQVGRLLRVIDLGVEP